MHFFRRLFFDSIEILHGAYVENKSVQLLRSDKWRRPDEFQRRRGSRCVSLTTVQSVLIVLAFDGVAIQLFILGGQTPSAIQY
jgi:hypothetical protein